jgi:2-oxo-4-hydroxy-4-carboxy-5-ureidoimidazoline decarboxylase
MVSMAETLDAFNAAPPDAAERDVLACCASTRFADAIVGGRPYRGPAALQAAMDASFSALSWDDIVEGMNAHPRIGERSAAGSPSAAEQSGAATASREVRQGLAEGNLAYEKRFGHVFLICASGRGPDEILAELRRRMAHDPVTELEVAAAEIGKINALRLRQLVTA